MNNNDDEDYEEDDDDYDELPNQTDNNSNTEEQEYDIESTKDLFNYKKGNTIEPKLLKNILGCFDLFNTAIEQKEYAYLSKLSPIEQIKTLSLCQKQFPLQDKDWKHAINYFLTKKDALERYYLLFMLKYEMYSPACNITRALFINDALYKFCHNLYLHQKKMNENNTQNLLHPIPGLAKGKFKYPDNINLYDDEIAIAFGV